MPFPSPGDLLNPGIERGSPILQADALPSEPPGSQIACYGGLKKGETPGSGAIVYSVLVTISDSQDTLLR